MTATSGTAPRTAARRGHTPRVVFVGNFGSANVGNEASLRSVRAAYEEVVEGVEFVCVCPWPERAAGMHGVESTSLRGRRPDHEPRLLHQVLRAPRAVGDVLRAALVTRRSDRVVIPGTGILDDFGQAPTGLPYDLVVWGLASRITRTPLHLVGVGAGPVENRTSRRLIAFATKLATVRTYRDPGSRQFLGSVGVDVSADTLMPDVVHSMDIPAATGSDSDRPIIGLGIMDYSGWSSDHPHGEWLREDFLGRTGALVRRLVESGAIVRVVTSGVDADQETVAALFDSLDQVTLASVEFPTRPAVIEDLVPQLTDLSVLVATRFHLVLLALAMGVPAVSIGYASRYEELMDSAGQGDRCHGIETFDPVEVARDVEELASEVDSLRPELRRWRAEQHEAAVAALRTMAEDLL